MLSAKQIPGIRNYFATVDGRIWRSDPSGSLKEVQARIENVNSPNRSPKEYRYFWAKSERTGRSSKFRVHTVVASCFLPVRPPGASMVLHRDDNTLNNAASNLRWGGASENLSDAFANGRISRDPRGKFCQARVDAVPFFVPVPVPLFFSALTESDTRYGGMRLAS